MSHPGGYTYVKGWAIRWWHERDWKYERIQVVLFLRGGKVNFTVGAALAREWMADLHRTENDGDSFHHFVYAVDQPAFTMSRQKAQEFRRALYKMLELGPKATPLQGYSSDDIRTAYTGLTQVNSVPKSRWV